MTFTKTTGLALVAALSLLSSCSDSDENISPVSTPSGSASGTVLPPAETTLDATSVSMLNSVSSTITARPSSLSSSESTFGTYANFRGVDIDGQTQLTITGSGFGTAVGRISFSDGAYVASTIVSWTDTRITLRARTTSTGAKANSNVTLTVTSVVDSKTSRSAGSMTVALTPTGYSRQWNQCTFWSTIRRIDTGRSVQPRGQSYSATSGSINNSYAPQTGDILIFGTAHQAFVESSSSSSVDEFQTVNGKRTLVSVLTTYRVSVSEYNITPEAYSIYTATVQIRRTVATGALTRVSGTFRSGYSSEATRYFR